MPTPKIYLIWKSEGRHRHKEFSNKESLNDFLLALDGSKVEGLKVISGFTIEERGDIN